MKYTVLHFDYSFVQEWQADLFHQQLFDLGFDTIDDNKAYIQTTLWINKHDEIEQLCTSTDGVSIISAEDCPDENWNATWEAEHPVQQLPLGVTIVPHCAFGAGHHETTSMLINTLVATDLSGKNVLDHGTGTGVLAIFAKRVGAQEVVAIDIDEKSVTNALENAALNGEIIEVNLGSTVPFSDECTQQYMAFDLIMANIHRNILLDAMPAYAQSLNAGGELWLSGFYESDCPALIEKATTHGLQHLRTTTNGEWCMLQFQK